MTAIRRRNTDRHSDERAMAATGGGKIRSRRYHIASKPYAKSKQVNSLTDFMIQVRVDGVMLYEMPRSLRRCFCFVEDISWPTVSARGLHVVHKMVVNKQPSI